MKSENLQQILCRFRIRASFAPARCATFSSFAHPPPLPLEGPCTSPIEALGRRRKALVTHKLVHTHTHTHTHTIGTPVGTPPPTINPIYPRVGIPRPKTRFCWALARVHTKSLLGTLISNLNRPRFGYRLLPQIRICVCGNGPRPPEAGFGTRDPRREDKIRARGPPTIECILGVPLFWDPFWGSKCLGGCLVYLVFCF
jgi:hypothetical protein